MSDTTEDDNSNADDYIIVIFYFKELIGSDNILVACVFLP